MPGFVTQPRSPSWPFLLRFRRPASRAQLKSARDFPPWRAHATGVIRPRPGSRRLLAATSPSWPPTCSRAWGMVEGPRHRRRVHRRPVPPGGSELIGDDGYFQSARWRGEVSGQGLRGGASLWVRASSSLSPDQPELRSRPSTTTPASSKAGHDEAEGIERQKDEGQGRLLRTARSRDGRPRQRGRGGKPLLPLPRPARRRAGGTRARHQSEVERGWA